MKTDMKLLCKKGHILGMIRETGNGVRELMLLRHAVDLKAECPAEIDVIGALEGRMPVQCDVPDCGDVVWWEATADVIAHLFEMAQGKRLEAVLRKIRERNEADKRREAE